MYRKKQATGFILRGYKRKKADAAHKYDLTFRVTSEKQNNR